MNAEPSQITANYQLVPTVPRYVTLVVLMLCPLPFLAGMVGFDFGYPVVPLPLGSPDIEQGASGFDVYTALRGPLWHVVLEWLTIAIGLMSCALAFSLFLMSRNIVAPVIGLTLLCAAGLDAFHSLAAVRVIDTVASYDHLMPFSWALARILSALLLFLAISALVVSKPKKPMHNHTRLLTILSLLFITVGFVIVQWALNSATIPTAIFAQDFVKRPYDVIPLVIYIVMGAFLLPRFRARYPGVFSDALVLSLFPAIVLELHMVLGSSQVFDHHFFAAHLLKILVYGVPFVGLVLDYHHTYNLSKLKTEQLHQTYRELQAKTHELQKTNRSLEESNRFKSEFLGSVSHELRTPLNAIIGFSRILLKTRNHNEDPKRYQAIESIFRNGSYLMMLINEILDLSKIETGRMMIEKSEFMVSTEVDEVYAEMQTLAAQKSINLQLLNYARNVKIVSDRAKLHQILINLGSNAVKYTEQGSVTVTVERSEHKELGDAICIKFTDSGIGIAKQEQSKLFVAFGRAEEARNSEHQGTGLGLMLAAKLVDILGGVIEFDSEHGVGSEFRVTFPISGFEHSPARQRDQSADSNYNDGILVVCADIDPDAAKYVEIALSERGVAVDSAHSLQQLLESVETLVPDLVIVDMKLEGEAGTTALQQLAAHPILKDIPSIATSVDPQTRSLAEQRGADIFLEKPCEDKVLVTQVRKLVYRDISSVLLVGVYHEHRKQLERELDDILIHTFFVPDHTVALEKLSQFMPDLIIVNLGNESVETARLMVVLNNDEHHRRLPVILYNGLESRQKFQFESDVVRELREAAPSSATLLDCFLGIRRNIRQRLMRIESVNRRLAAEQPQRDEALPDKLLKSDAARVLIVDAGNDTSVLIDWVLQDIQVAHEIVAGGREALKRVLEKTYSALFIALDLPDLHGREVLRRLRATNAYRDTPIVAINSEEHPVQDQELRELGFNDVIDKPVDSDRLLAVLRQYVVIT